MARDIMNNFAAAGRVADMDSIREIEMRRHRREIVGIVIHIVPVAALAGPAVAAAVMGDDAVATIQEEHQLCVPVVA